MNKVFASWSGGKDSCLALHRAATNGLKASYLVNTITEDGQRSRSHGLTAEVLQTQSQAIGIPLVQIRMTTASYEAEFKKAILDLKKRGITSGIFGDIDFNEHRNWIERVCRETAITPYLPLWEDSHDNIMREFIDLGFKAIVVAAKADFFGEEILGRVIDRDFIKYLEGMTDITLCGEAGEYHSFVIDGPMFRQRIEILETRKVLREGRWFLDILKTDLRDKS